MNANKYSVKSYVMVTTSEYGNQKAIIQALSIADAKHILKQQTGYNWYFKGYAEN